MMNEKEKKILSWLEERIGENYIWGGTGYILTQNNYDYSYIKDKNTHQVTLLHE